MLYPVYYGAILQTLGLWKKNTASNAIKAARGTKEHSFEYSASMSTEM